MVGQNSTGIDRSRTYWTPTMERYFIDLMLEQMHRGARIGHTFNKQAWTDMLAMFNAKFGSQYDKDVLKNRYTNLWKQFNDVRNLLSQNGFAWDDNRQMVVADDFVWDAYIKAHPDARSYKTKAVLNFNDLCLIYSYTTADGRYSRSSHDVDFDDEVQGVHIGDGIYSIAPSSNDRQRTDWTPEMDQYFIELMLDQVGRGNKVANAFNKQAWTDMLALFNAKFGPQHGKRVLRHRHKKLWKYYTDITALLKQEGFSWDEAQQTVAADDNVWDAYTKTHPHSRTYRTKALPNYHDLILIFANEISNELNEGSHQEKNLEDDALQLKAGEGKGNQASSVGDRTRTYWTPPMDRYLIDLLLDQAHRGNKLGKTFISQAWIDMVASFNVQFKSCHDKDVLKNRYKHLKRQYNDMKVILEQSGFSWDESREMILAEDHVWDAYIQVHPDARCYRVKTIPGFHKLCVIFGEEHSDGRYSRLARDAEPICELPVLMTSDEKNDQSPVDAVPLRIEWTPPVNRYFVDLMLEQVQKGNKIDNTFNEQAWAYMLKSFHKRSGLKCDKCVLEDRYLWLKKQYDDICKLLSCTGFEWDETKQMVIAENDVWEAYIKEQPDAVLYRNVCLSSYSDLCKICQNPVLDERLDGKNTEKISDGWGAEMAAAPISLETEIDGASGNLLLPAEEVFMSKKQKKRPISMSLDSGRTRKVQKSHENKLDSLSEMADLVAELVTKTENKNGHSIEAAVDALQAIPDLDDELLLDACDLLEDEKKAKMFLALDVALRKKWLLRKLRP
ncbi:Myb/SANT-like domain containing protein [Trema orientale]|uniref:Myb/SANT-like domain containing protein n=1 Tax=Trema orientale TaxID=63057 RepID=A0A2P5EHV7_TREOI|nr:Myb/SANT-like domain containing protein [Trema orientale]